MLTSTLTLTPSDTQTAADLDALRLDLVRNNRQTCRTLIHILAELGEPLDVRRCDPPYQYVARQLGEMTLHALYGHNSGPWVKSLRAFANQETLIIAVAPEGVEWWNARRVVNLGWSDGELRDPTWALYVPGDWESVLLDMLPAADRRTDARADAREAERVAKLRYDLWLD